MPQVKFNFSPSFVIKITKYAYMTKLLPMICLYDTKFIQIKKYILRVIAM